MELRKFETLSKEELSKLRQTMNSWIDKLGASNILIFPMNEQDNEFIVEDVNGRIYFNPYKR